MGFRPCSSCGHFGRAHFSRKQYGAGIALPCFGGCDGWMWEGWSPTTTHLCGSGWQYSKRVEKLDKSHLCSTAGAKPLSEVTWFANARFLHFTLVYFFLNGMIVLIFLFFLLLIQQKTHRSKVHGDDDDDEGFTYPWCYRIFPVLQT